MFNIKDNYTVYMHTSPEGKKYIGCTCQLPEKRWNNGNGYIQNKEFICDILKYGWDNFNHEIVISNLSRKDALINESQLIIDYDTTNSDFGYNKITKEGSYWLNKKLTKQHKEKIGVSRTGKYTGENNPNYGNHKLAGVNNPRAKSVICINTNKIYDTIKEAAEDMFLDKHHISSCCKGRRKSAGKHPETGEPLIWMYYEEWLKLSQEQKDNIVYKNRHHSSVICVTTNEIFEMITLGADKYNVFVTSISACCKGKQKSAGKHPVTGEKLVWMYYDEYLTLQHINDIINI